LKFLENAPQIQGGINLNILCPGFLPIKSNHKIFEQKKQYLIMTKEKTVEVAINGLQTSQNFQFYTQGIETLRLFKNSLLKAGLETEKRCIDAQLGRKGMGTAENLRGFMVCMADAGAQLHARQKVHKGFEEKINALYQRKETSQLRCLQKHDSASEQAACIENEMKIV
jgi:hypothetical protein